MGLGFGILRREDEKLEAAQVRRIIAIASCYQLVSPKSDVGGSLGDGGWTKSAATWNSESNA